MLTTVDLDAFAQRWLAAWTGNHPNELIKFYSHDAFYSDPGQTAGLRTRDQLLPYFQKLLAANPKWVWTPLEVLPTAKGFCLKWQAEIPVGPKTVRETGLDIVELDETGLISRNEVYFDRSALLSALHELKATRQS